MVTTVYEDLLRDILKNGVHKDDRTGTGTTSVFGRQIRYDLSEGFPLITTKRVPFRLIAEELLWFLRGESNILSLVQKDVGIWSDWPYKKWLQSQGLEVPRGDTQEWADGMKKFEQRLLSDPTFAEEFGELGPVYGVQWRSWPASDGGSIDQIAHVVDQIKQRPDSRRLIVSAWNPAEVDQMALPPCHALFQFYVADGKLSCQLYQRSCDTFLGVPFNIASYALLLMMIAHQCDLEPGEFVWTGGDVHIYDNHREQVALQLSREARALPTLKFKRKPESIFDYTIDDFEVVGYKPHPGISAPVAV